MHKAACLAAALMMVFSLSMAQAQSAVIDNGADAATMLNVRTAPDKSALALGKFLSGTQVEILGDAGNGFSRIAIGSGNGAVTGYAVTQYLSGSAKVNATYEACVASPYGTQSVVLRDAPSNSYHPVAMLMVGERVLVIGEMGEFRYVKTGGGCVGCLLGSELK